MSTGSGQGDPRITRTRHDVIAATAELLQSEGWTEVTHATVAQRSGYAKATIYTHWPTRLDLVRDAVEHICAAATHPVPTGDLRADLVAGLTDFADDLSSGRLARILGGIIERSGTDPAVEQMRRRLYDTGTGALRAVLEAHLDEESVEILLPLLTGAVLIRVAFQGNPATNAFITDVVDRTLGSVR